MPNHNNAKASLMVDYENKHYEGMSMYFYDLVCLMGSEELDLEKVKLTFFKFKEAFNTHLKSFDHKQQSAEDLTKILSQALEQQYNLEGNLEDKEKIIRTTEMGFRLTGRYDLIVACITDYPNPDGTDEYLVSTVISGASRFFCDSELGEKKLNSFQSALNKGILEMRTLESTLSNQNERKIVNDLIGHMDKIKAETEDNDIPAASRYLDGVDKFQKAVQSSVFTIQKNNNILSQKIKNIVDNIKAALGLIEKKPDNPFSSTFLFGRSQKSIIQTYEDIATPVR